MLGRIVVRYVSLVLNLVGILIIVVGTIWGFLVADDLVGYLGALGSSVDPLLARIAGGLIGFVLSFAAMILVLGVPFLAIEVHNDLLRVRDKVDALAALRIPLTPDLV